MFNFQTFLQDSILHWMRGPKAAADCLLGGEGGPGAYVKAHAAGVDSRKQHGTGLGRCHRPPPPACPLRVFCWPGFQCGKSSSCVNELATGAWRPLLTLGPLQWKERPNFCLLICSGVMFPPHRLCHQCYSYRRNIVT